MTVSASPRASTTGAITNRPRCCTRYRVISARKKITATQVTEVTNSYMSPHGTRCTASPRMTTPRKCAATPKTVSAMAARTHWLAGASAERPGPAEPDPAEPDPAGPPAAAAPGATASAPAPVAVTLPAPVLAARPTGTSSATSTGAAG